MCSTQWMGQIATREVIDNFPFLAAIRYQNTNRLVECDLDPAEEKATLGTQDAYFMFFCKRVIEEVLLPLNLVTEEVLLSLNLTSLDGWTLMHESLPMTPKTFHQLRLRCQSVVLTLCRSRTSYKMAHSKSDIDRRGSRKRKRCEDECEASAKRFRHPEEESSPVIPPRLLDRTKLSGRSATPDMQHEPERTQYPTRTEGSSNFRPQLASLLPKTYTPNPNPISAARPQIPQPAPVPLYATPTTCFTTGPPQYLYS